jgi:hypothetical protein
VTGFRDPDLSTLRVVGKRLKAELDDVITEVTLNYPTSTLAELTIAAMDPRAQLLSSPLAATGTAVAFAGERWEVGTIEVEMSGDDIVVVNVRARSPLGRKLRKTYGGSAEKQVSPSQWVSRMVKKLGGRAVVQSTNKRGAISQRSGSDKQSVLDVIGELGGELDFDWVEAGGTFYFGSRHWAWQGGAGTPTWPVTWRSDARSDAYTLTWSDSDDDTAVKATLEVEIPHAAGLKIRPWHRLRVGGAGKASGTWLVDAVDVTYDTVSPVRVSASIPHKPNPSKSKGDS